MKAWQIVLEIAKNGLMCLPLVSYIRKRRYAVHDDPLSEISRQGDLHWKTYTDALLAAGLGIDFLVGARVLEIGPGPILGNAVRFVAFGVHRYFGIDRYPLFRTDRIVREAYRDMIATLSLQEQERCKDLVVWSSKRKNDLFDDRISTLVLSVEEVAEKLPPDCFDLIVSFNVMEHVGDVKKTLDNMVYLLKQGGVMIHRIDVGTHADRASVHPLWQLTVPSWLWRLMYSQRAYPNRMRPSEYLRLAEQAGLETLVYQTGNHLPAIEVARLRAHLQPELRSYSVDDLATLDFVWVVQKQQK